MFPQIVQLPIELLYLADLSRRESQFEWSEAASIPQHGTILR